MNENDDTSRNQQNVNNVCNMVPTTTIHNTISNFKVRLIDKRNLFEKREFIGVARCEDHITYGIVS